MSGADVVVFLGPTLGRDEARALLDADYRPPAAQGDVYRAARAGARAIAIIDGVFERSPAVWHKEVLWALSEGVHVWGASSMGALRAAELHGFGMVGVGEVFRAYRDGSLDADDAVAVAHSTAEHGWRSLSVALVDTRSALSIACSEGVITEPERATLARCAGGRFFSERAWPTLFDDGLAAGVAEDSIARLRAWTMATPRSQKADDARALLRGLGVFLTASPKRFEARFRFERTDAWESFVADEDARRGAVDDDASSRVTPELMADLALDGHLDAVQLEATVLGLARIEAKRQGVTVTDGARRESESLLRAKLSIRGDGELAAWLDARGLSATEWAARVDDFALRQWYLGVLVPVAARHLGAVTQTRATVDARPFSAQGDDDAMLRAWFEGDIPEDLDAWMRSRGIASREALIAALRRRASR